MYVITETDWAAPPATTTTTTAKSSTLYVVFVHRILWVVV